MELNSLSHYLPQELRYGIPVHHLYITTLVGISTTLLERPPGGKYLMIPTFIAENYLIAD